MSKKINFKITENEYEIMDALWRECVPLTRSGILESIKNEDFNENSFYRFLNGLLKKGFIKEGENSVIHMVNVDHTNADITTSGYFKWNNATYINTSIYDRVVRN